MQAWRSASLALAMLVFAGPALAAATLAGRSSNLYGQYLIGAGGSGESGAASDSETSTEDRPALQVDAVAEKSGATSGTPWTAQATLSAGHQFLRDESGGTLARLTSTGSSQTFAQASWPALAFASIAGSGNWLTLEFSVDAPTPYTLVATVSASGTVAQDISATVQLQQAAGSRWGAVQIISTGLGHGTEFRDGVLNPGLYRMSAQAAVESFHAGPVASSASWNYDLSFSPVAVPDPAAVWLLLAGGGVIAWQRRVLRLERPRRRNVGVCTQFLRRPCP